VRRAHGYVVKGVIETATVANRPCLAEVVVDRKIHPADTGTWSLPHLPHPTHSRMA